MYVCLPRFHDLPFEEKILTLFHELYHISPKCDGSLRVFPGRNRFHGSSEREYDRRLMPEVESYLQERSRSGLLDFLHIPTEDLESQFGRLTGLYVRMPTFEIRYDE